MLQLVLASSSPRRQALIHSLGLKLPIRIVSPEVDEQVEADWAPRQIVEQLSLRKARASSRQIAQSGQAAGEAPSLIVGADTIVVLDGEVMGKPVDEADAKRMLGRLQGRAHEVYSGIACINTGDGREVVASRMTQVWMKPMAADRIARYVASGEPMDKAGSYAIQGIGAALVNRIDGCYFNVVGMSLSLLSELLSEFQVEVI
ncbi:septum formation protein Maf [Paenibacillaceae bacterium]|nr:septum formation protein Maf [Paenibacillaceae bacterium]